jgi:hypothetical protein
VEGGFICRVGIVAGPRYLKLGFEQSRPYG